MVQVESVFLHAPDAQQRKQLHRLDDDILIAALSFARGSSIEVATLDEHRAALPGLFGKRDRHGLRRPESAGFLQIQQGRKATKWATSEWSRGRSLHKSPGNAVVPPTEFESVPPA